MNSINIQDIVRRVARDKAGAAYFSSGVVVTPPNGMLWSTNRSHIIEAKWGHWKARPQALTDLASKMDEGLEPCTTEDCVFCTEVPIGRANG